MSEPDDGVRELTPSGRGLADADQVMLIDSKERKYLVTLQTGGQFHFHRGFVPHDDIIGLESGSWVESSAGAKLIVLHPRLADFVLRMKRGAQVVYPKDMGQIVIWGDIAPGQTVVEAGTGSGALTCALGRIVGERGRLVSVERREDHAAHARKTITRFFGEVPPWIELRIGEVVDAIAEVRPERVVLDLPEPFGVVPTVAEAMQAGGVLTTYVPTVPQLEQTQAALDEAGCFTDVMHREVMQRTWNVSGRSVRPDHRMVGHTGFLTFARKLSGAP